jgi:hypothetical protein
MNKKYFRNDGLNVAVKRGYFNGKIVKKVKIYIFFSFSMAEVISFHFAINGFLS